MICCKVIALANSWNSLFGFGFIHLIKCKSHGSQTGSFDFELKTTGFLAYSPKKSYGKSGSANSFISSSI